MAKRHRRKFKDDFKAETVDLIRESGRSVGSVSKEFSLTGTAVRNWVKRAEASGSPAFHVLSYGPQLVSDLHDAGVVGPPALAAERTPR